MKSFLEFTEEYGLSQKELDGPAHNDEGLPLPRLQLRWERGNKDPSDPEAGKEPDRNVFVCFYELVMPLRELDIRRENEEGKDVKSVLRLPISVSASCGGRDTRINRDGNVDTPYRDGSHARWDSLVLRLPIYATYVGVSSEVKRASED